MSSKNLSIRVPEEQYSFIANLAEEEHEDISATVRKLMDLGRVMLSIQKYRAGDASMERAARLAGVSVARMMDILRDYVLPPTWKIMITWRVSSRRRS